MRDTSPTALAPRFSVDAVKTFPRPSENITSLRQQNMLRRSGDNWRGLSSQSTSAT